VEHNTLRREACSHLGTAEYEPVRYPPSSCSSGEREGQQAGAKPRYRFSVPTPERISRPCPKDYWPLLRVNYWPEVQVSTSRSVLCQLQRHFPGLCLKDNVPQGNATTVPGDRIRSKKVPVPHHAQRTEISSFSGWCALGLDLNLTYQAVIDGHGRTRRGTQLALFSSKCFISQPLATLQRLACYQLHYPGSVQGQDRVAQLRGSVYPTA
jgi:hypothetical protein